MHRRNLLKKDSGDARTTSAFMSPEYPPQKKRAEALLPKGVPATYAITDNNVVRGDDA